MSAIFYVSFGSIWEALSAIGTIAAPVIELWLAMDKRRRKLSASLLLERVTEYSATLIIHNPSSKEIILKQIDYSYKRRKYEGTKFFENSRYEKDLIIPPNVTKQFTVPMPKELYAQLKEEERNGIIGDGVHLSKKYLKRASKKHIFALIITDLDNHKYRTTQKYTDRELLTLLFGEHLFKTNN